jgi:hypothetical protein
MQTSLTAWIGRSVAGVLQCMRPTRRLQPTGDLVGTRRWSAVIEAWGNQRPPASPHPQRHHDR